MFRIFKNREETPVRAFMKHIQKTNAPWMNSFNVFADPADKYMAMRNARHFFKSEAVATLRNAKQAAAASYDKKAENLKGIAAMLVCVPMYLGIDHGLSPYMQLGVEGGAQIALTCTYYAVNLVVSAVVGGLAVQKLHNYIDSKIKQPIVKKEMQPVYQLMRDYNFEAKRKLRALEETHVQELLQAAPAMAQRVPQTVPHLARLKFMQERKLASEMALFHEGNAQALRTSGKLQLKTPRATAGLKGIGR